MCARRLSSTDKFGSHYYPTPDQLADPKRAANVLRVILDQFYALQDQHDALRRDHSTLQAKVEEKQSGPPPGSGPTDTLLLGLRVAPVDTQTLSNGATLKFNKSSGNFSFQ